MTVIIDERVAGGRPVRPVKVAAPRTSIAKITAALGAFLLK